MAEYDITNLSFDKVTEQLIVDIDDPNKKFKEYETSKDSRLLQGMGVSQVPASQTPGTGHWVHAESYYLIISITKHADTGTSTLKVLNTRYYKAEDSLPNCGDANRSTEECKKTIDIVVYDKKDGETKTIRRKAVVVKDGGGGRVRIA